VRWQRDSEDEPVSLFQNRRTTKRFSIVMMKHDLVTITKRQLTAAQQVSGVPEQEPLSKLSLQHCSAALPSDASRRNAPLVLNVAGQSSIVTPSLIKVM
jgi:hypothetical protein